MEALKALDDLASICEVVDRRGGFTLSELMTVHDICKFVQHNYPRYPKSVTPEILKDREYYDGYTIDMLVYQADEFGKCLKAHKLHALIGLIASRAALCLRNHNYINTLSK